MVDRVGATTIERIALGFQPTYLSNRKRRFFHVIGGPVPARHPVRRVVRVYRGFPTGEPLLYDNIGQRLVMRVARPTPHHARRVTSSSLSSASRSTSRRGSN